MKYEVTVFPSAVNAWLGDDTDPPSVFISMKDAPGRSGWEWRRLTMDQAIHLRDQLYLLTRDHDDVADPAGMLPHVDT